MRHIAELSMTVPEIELLQAAIRAQDLKVTAAFESEKVAVQHQTREWEKHLKVTDAFRVAEDAKKTYRRELDNLFVLLDKWYAKGTYDSRPVCIDGVEYSKESWKTWTANGSNV